MGKNRVELICSVAELTGMFAGGKSLDDFCEAIARQMLACGRIDQVEKLLA